MKIDGSTPFVQGGSATEGHGRPGKAGASPVAPGASSSPRVELSPLGSHLAGIEARLAEVPVVDTQRVEEIKLAMSEGRFKVNPEMVADKLLETVRELIQAQQGG